MFQPAGVLAREREEQKHRVILLEGAVERRVELRLLPAAQLAAKVRGGHGGRPLGLQQQQVGGDTLKVAARRLQERGLTCDEKVLYTLMRGLLAPHEVEEAMERAKSKKVRGS